jgi:hypothetical protein
MSASLLFVCGTASTLLVSLVVVRYMHKALGKLLGELCGNRERAEFWTVFSDVTVALVPVIFAMQYRPDLRSDALLEIAGQLKWGLIGLVTSILMLGWITSRFIPKSQPQRSLPKE